MYGEFAVLPATLDSLDAGIIREFSGPNGTYQWNVRQSYSKIAQKLGVDEETVRRRIRLARKSGLIQGSEIIPNPFLIGREPVRILLRVVNPEIAKQVAISEIKLVDGVLLIVETLGDSLQVILFCEDEDVISRRIQLLSSICGCKDPSVLRNADALGYRRCELKPTATDLAILKSLRRDPRKSAIRVAKEIKVSSRTVERRIGILIDNGAFFHMFRLDFQKANGVVCSVTVSYENEKKKRLLDSIITAKLERVIYSVTAAKMVSQFNFVCSNVIEAEEIHGWIRSLEGVVKEDMGFIKDYILVSGWLDKELERMLSSLGTA